MEDISSLYEHELVVNTTNGISITDFSNINYIRHKILYEGNVVIDRTLFSNVNNHSVKYIEGEVIEYFIRTSVKHTHHEVWV